MKKAYEGLTFTGTLYYDILCAVKYKHEGNTVQRVHGWLDMGKFNKEYGYPEPNASASDDWKQYGDAIQFLEKNGLIKREYYSRPAGRGFVSWYWRIQPVLHGDKLAIADKYIAAMNK